MERDECTIYNKVLAMLRNLNCIMELTMDVSMPESKISMATVMLNESYKIHTDIAPVIGSTDEMLPMGTQMIGTLSEIIEQLSAFSDEIDAKLRDKENVNHRGAIRLLIDDLDQWQERLLHPTDRQLNRLMGLLRDAFRTSRQGKKARNEFRCWEASFKADKRQEHIQAAVRSEVSHLAESIGSEYLGDVIEDGQHVDAISLARCLYLTPECMEGTHITKGSCTMNDRLMQILKSDYMLQRLNECILRQQDPSALNAEQQEQAVRESLAEWLQTKQDDGQELVRFGNHYFAVYRVLCDKGICTPGKYTEATRYLSRLLSEEGQPQIRASLSKPVTRFGRVVRIGPTTLKDASDDYPDKPIEKWIFNGKITVKREKFDGMLLCATRFQEILERKMAEMLRRNERMDIFK